MLAEAFEMFVVEPIFHKTVSWDSPIIPLFIVLCVLIPVGIMIARSAFFNPDYKKGEW